MAGKLASLANGGVQLAGGDLCGEPFGGGLGCEQLEDPAPGRAQRLAHRMEAPDHPCRPACQGGFGAAGRLRTGAAAVAVGVRPPAGFARFLDHGFSRASASPRGFAGLYAGYGQVGRDGNRPWRLPDAFAARAPGGGRVVRDTALPVSRIWVLTCIAPRLITSASRRLAGFFVTGTRFVRPRPTQIRALPGRPGQARRDGGMSRAAKGADCKSAA